MNEEYNADLGRKIEYRGPYKCQKCGREISEGRACPCDTSLWPVVLIAALVILGVVLWMAWVVDEIVHPQWAKQRMESRTCSGSGMLTSRAGDLYDCLDGHLRKVEGGGSHGVTPLKPLQSGAAEALAVPITCPGPECTPYQEPPCTVYGYYDTTLSALRPCEKAVYQPITCDPNNHSWANTAFGQAPPCELPLAPAKGTAKKHATVLRSGPGYSSGAVVVQKHPFVYNGVRLDPSALADKYAIRDTRESIGAASMDLSKGSCDGCMADTTETTYLCELVDLYPILIIRGHEKETVMVPKP